MRMVILVLVFSFLSLLFYYVAGHAMITGIARLRKKKELLAKLGKEQEVYRDLAGRYRIMGTAAKKILQTFPTWATKEHVGRALKISSGLRECGSIIELIRNNISNNVLDVDGLFLDLKSQCDEIREHVNCLDGLPDKITLYAKKANEEMRYCNTAIADGWVEIGVMKGNGIDCDLSKVKILEFEKKFKEIELRHQQGEFDLQDGSREISDDFSVLKDEIHKLLITVSGLDGQRHRCLEFLKTASSDFDNLRRGVMVNIETMERIKKKGVPIAIWSPAGYAFSDSHIDINVLGRLVEEFQNQSLTTESGILQADKLIVRIVNASNPIKKGIQGVDDLVLTLTLDSAEMTA